MVEVVDVVGMMDEVEVLTVVEVAIEVVPVVSRGNGPDRSTSGACAAGGY